MKAWIGISLGIHLAVFGVCGSRPAPSRNLVPPGNVYSVSLVSLPVARSLPQAKAAAADKPVENVKTPPPVKSETVDPKAVKPPAPDAAKKPAPKEAKAKPAEQTKPEAKAEEKKTEEAAAQEEPAKDEGPGEGSGAGEGPGGPAAVSALGQTNTQGAVSLDAANFGFSYYLVALQAKVAANWFPPGSVGAPGEVLRATIHFRVMDDGTIKDAVVENSSGVPYFDRCALRAILASSPLAPLPEAFEEDELGVHFEFTHTVSVR